MTRPFPAVEALVAGIFAGDRALIGRALTLVESKLPAHRESARTLLEQLAPRTGKALRVGITGVPGVGKSTLIDALGVYLISKGMRVAVLAVDPSSERSGGSILGDKTRMARLSNDPRAFIRPSPSGGTLGGVAARTREAMSVLEAAGFDVVLVETVGVGQSETAVRHLTDTFVLLMLAGAGDGLQGIKRGIMELADLVLVTKADGDNVRRADRAAAELRGALHLMQPVSEGWEPPVIATSATSGAGLEAAWSKVLAHREHLEATGELGRVRSEQARRWLWALVDEGLRARVRLVPGLPEVEAEVVAGRCPVERGAARILEALSEM
jgi:LAO/AO transport system kinase